MARSIRPPKLPKLSVPKLPNLNITEPYEDVFEEMTLGQHIGELRDRIVKVSVSIGLAFVAGFFLAKPLLDVIVDAAQATGSGLDIQSPTEPFTLYMKVALYIAFSIAMPVIVFHLIGFLAPGLTRREKRVVYISLPFVALLFVGGAAFAFFVAAPRALAFLSGFQSGIFAWEPDGGEVINFYMTLMIGVGLAFELPIVMFLLSQMKIVDSKRFRQYRKYAAIGILISSAIITPTPDPFNMAIVASPMFLLYEFGIIISRLKVRL